MRIGTRYGRRLRVPCSHLVCMHVWFKYQIESFCLLYFPRGFSVLRARPSTKSTGGFLGGFTELHGYLERKIRHGCSIKRELTVGRLRESSAGELQVQSSPSRYAVLYYAFQATSRPVSQQDSVENGPLEMSRH